MTTTIAETFKGEPIWTEAEVAYLSKQHVPDPKEANRIIGESCGSPALADEEEGPDECHLRWITDEAERKQLAEQMDGGDFDPDHPGLDYFKECSESEGEPFWKVEA
jgi:hypothetical protein